MPSPHTQASARQGSVASATPAPLVPLGQNTQPFSLDYAARPCTHNPPWGGLTVLDVLLNNVSLGLFLVACLALALLPGNLAPVLAPAFLLGWLVLLADLALLVLDLGDPWRFHHMLRTVRPLSPIWVGVWALSGAAICMTPSALWGALVLFGWLHPAAPPDWLTFFLMPAVLCASVGLMYKGVLFSATSRPVWKDARWFAAGLCSGSILLGTALFALLCMAFAPELTRRVLSALFPLICLDLLWIERGLVPLFVDGTGRKILRLPIALDSLAVICLLAALVTSQTATPGVVLALVAAGWCSRYSVVTA